MVPLVITKTLNQVTPHQHSLVREEVSIANSTDDDEGGFICSGCDTYGTAKDVKYRCKEQNCNFNLHEDCATCPKTLFTHIHPNHQLKLGWSFKDDLPCCDVCGDQVKGLYYSCPDASCNNHDNTFVLHPICSKFPWQWSHITDRKHNLTFQSAAPSWCTICRDPCTSWRYRCGPCGIDIHIECIFSAPCHDPPNSGAPTPQQQEQQHLYQPPPFPHLYQPPPLPPPPHPPMQQQHLYQPPPFPPPPPPPMQQQHHYHHHQEKRPLPNPFGYPPQQPPPLLPLQQPPPMQQQQYYHHHQEKHPLPIHFAYPLQQPPLPAPPPMQQQHQQQHHYHHHQEKRPLPNHFGFPLQQPPLPSAYCYVYNPSSAFGMVSPPPVHHQCYYGQQQQQQQYQQPVSPFVAHPYNMYYQQQQPAYYHPGGGGAEVVGAGAGAGLTNISSNSTSTSTSPSTSGGRSRKWRMSIMVAKMAAYLAVSSVFGPVILPF